MDLVVSPPSIGHPPEISIATDLPQDFRVSSSSSDQSLLSSFATLLISLTTALIFQGNPNLFLSLWVSSFSFFTPWEIFPLRIYFFLCRPSGRWTNWCRADYFCDNNSIFWRIGPPSVLVAPTFWRLETLCWWTGQESLPRMHSIKIFKVVLISPLRSQLTFFEKKTQNFSRISLMIKACLVLASGKRIKSSANARWEILGPLLEVWIGCHVLWPTTRSIKWKSLYKQRIKM